MSAASPVEVEPTLTPDEITFLAKPWVTLVWDDPVNLMSYVSYVFQKYFGYDKAKADKLMLEVHHDGKSGSFHTSHAVIGRYGVRQLVGRARTVHQYEPPGP